jgi:peptidoglycan/LPS O-acetylase OafA/YrhL
MTTEVQVVRRRLLGDYPGAYEKGLLRSNTAGSFPVAIGEATSDPGRRIVTLDGLRGLLTILVMLSHYFGEVPHGFRIAMCGWVAVDMFFILSGFLIGKLILERHHHANFFLVFYVRRFLRIIPVYFIVVLIVGAIIHYFPRPWMEAESNFPLWSYLSFTQIFYMITTQSIGAHWLAPTWTMTVEEHFYLVAPALIAFTPRKWLVPVLVSCAVFSFFLRLFLFTTDAGTMAGFVLLPARADTLICGMLAAVAVRSALPWVRIIPLLRMIPFLAIIGLAATLMNEGMTVYYIANSSLVAIGGSAYILCVVLGALNGVDYSSKMLQFFGNNGLCIYLIHLPVLGLMHGVILGGIPDIATPAQWLITIAALPVTVLLSRALTKLVEEPLSAYGRTWRWSVPR